MNQAAQLKKAVDELASKGERAAYNQALRDVLEDVEAGERAYETYNELKARIKARREKDILKSFTGTKVYTNGPIRS